MPNINRGATSVNDQVFHDLGPRPVRVKNEAHLKHLCEEGGFISPHLENATHPGGSQCKTYVMRGGRLVLKKK